MFIVFLVDRRLTSRGKYDAEKDDDPTHADKHFYLA